MERTISQNLETNNRKLLELLGASRLAENVRENCDLTFNTLLDNIADCIYADVSNVGLPSTDNGITLLHINMRSINNGKNFDKFEEFLKALPCLPDIVCVSKTRIKGDPLVYILLPQYNLVHGDSTTRAGGVAIYVSKKFRFETEPKFKMKIDGGKDL